MMGDRIEIEALSKSYGAFQAIAELSLAVAPDQILGLVGTSGAGKSTLLRLVGGLVPPDAGRILLNGYDLARQREIARASVSAMIQIDPELAPGGIGLQWECMVDGQPFSVSSNATSHGTRHRTALTRILSSHASILLLDEPAIGLEPWRVETMGNQLRQLAHHRGATIVLTTRDPVLAHALCDRIAVLTAGRLTMDVPVRRALGLSTPAIYRIQVGGCLDDRWATWFDGLEIERAVERTTISGRMSDQSALHSLLARIRDLGLPLLSVEWIPSELADVVARVAHGQTKGWKNVRSDRP
jgi:ABC-type multidrug transport system ATPase subunit